MSKPYFNAQTTAVSPSIDLAYKEGDPKPKGAYPFCACGCKAQTNPGSAIVGYPYTQQRLWCATAQCADRVKSKLMSSESRKRLYAPWH